MEAGDVILECHGQPVRHPDELVALITSIVPGTRAAVLSFAMDVVNRVSDGRHIAYVHHRLWPALVRRAPNLGHARPARLREVHTKSGAHRTEAQPFPGWVPNDVRRAGRGPHQDSAIRQVAEWIAPLRLR